MIYGRFSVATDGASPLEQKNIESIPTYLIADAATLQLCFGFKGEPLRRERQCFL